MAGNGQNNNPTGRNQYSDKDKQQWLRVRFHASQNDYRPVKFPPPGPYWCSGTGDDYSIIVAYVKKLSQVEKYWPEADSIDHLGNYEQIEFTERFAKPDWWKA